MRAILLLGLATVATSPGSAAAQGAFNMGGLTGTLSQDAVTQSEGARAARPAPRARKLTRRELAEACSVRHYFSPESRRTPKAQAFERRCRANGF